MLYLASPYSHPDPAIRNQRYHAACAAVVSLLREGHAVFSPVVHSHPLVALGLPADWAFWQRQDLAHLAGCDELVVLMLDGWEQSTGVQAEIRHAAELGIPVWYRSPVRPTTPTLAHVATEAGL